MVRVDPDDPKHLIVWFEQEPDEARAVHEMVRLYVDENLGYKKIAFELDKLGYKPREARGWSGQTVRGVLNNPALGGTTDYRASTGELIVFEGKFEPPILSPDEVKALHDRFAIRREHPRGRTQASDFLLSGIARCGMCKGPLVGTHAWVSNRKGGYYKYRRYACSRWQANRALCSRGVSHSADALERAVLWELQSYEDPQRLHELHAEHKSGRDEGAELRRTQRKLAELERDFLKDMDRLDRGILDEADFARINRVRKTERAALEKTRDELEARAHSARERTAVVDALPARVRDLMSTVDRAEVRKAKALLQGILHAAHVYPDKRVELEFRT